MKINKKNNKPSILDEETVMLNPEKLFQPLDPTGKACDVTVVSSMELSLETDATLKRELFSMVWQVN